MKKEYIYNPKQYLVQITVTAFFCAAIFFVTIFMAVIDFHRYLFCFVGIIAFYTAWNTFVSRCNPSKIILEEDGITFFSYGKTTKYLFDEIQIFRVKDFRYSGKMFVRINNYNMFKGRYWINTKEFNDPMELFLFLMKLEHKTHPDSMKARAWDSTKPDYDKTPVLPWNLPPGEQ